jgi:hypothetical protein
MDLRSGSGKIGGLMLPHFENNIQRCITLCDTKVILLPKFWRLPLNVSFRRDLSGQRLVSWNALLIRLADIHLEPGHDKFHWNLHENGKFSIASMYNALI